MPKPPDLDLFAAAGIELDVERTRAKLKRPRKPKPPTPAERAAAVRLEGGRRSRALASLGQRSRIGRPRELSPAPVLAFPLARNAAVLREVMKRLPHCEPEELDVVCDLEARKFEKRLIRRGLQKQSARRCAKDLLHEAYMERVRDLSERT